MSGICSRHKHHEQGCPLCEAKESEMVVKQWTPKRLSKFLSENPDCTVVLERRKERETDTPQDAS